MPFSSDVHANVPRAVDHAGLPVVEQRFKLRGNNCDVLKPDDCFHASMRNMYKNVGATLDCKGLGSQVAKIFDEQLSKGDTLQQCISAIGSGTLAGPDDEAVTLARYNLGGLLKAAGADLEADDLHPTVSTSTAGVESPILGSCYMPGPSWPKTQRRT